MFTSFGLLCSRRRGGPERPDYEFKVHGVNRATHRPVGVCRWLWCSLGKTLSVRQIACRPRAI